MEFEPGSPLWIAAVAAANVAIIAGYGRLSRYVSPRFPRWAYSAGRACRRLLPRTSARRSEQGQRTALLQQELRDRIGYSGPRRLEYFLNTLPPTIDTKIN